MLPKVYRTIHTPEVAAIVGDRIGRHGEISQTETRPYIVWALISDADYQQLSGPACADLNSVQIDCWHAEDAGVETLAAAVRSALDAAGINNRIVINDRDTETRLYRIGMDADFIDPR